MRLVKSFASLAACGRPQHLKRGRAADKAELLYDSAFNSVGERRIEFARQYLNLLQKCHPGDRAEVLDFAIDMFVQDASLKVLDAETRWRLFPYARHFAHGVWDEALLRKQLLDQE